MPLPDLSNVSIYYQNLDLLTQTVEQIKKDFGVFNIEIYFSGNANTAYSELFDQIYPIIAGFLKSNYQTLYNILYRIDIGESQISKSSSLNPGKTLPQVITELIIKRELQKVVIRNYYR